MSVRPASQTDITSQASLPETRPLLEIVGNPLPESLLHLIVCHLPEDEGQNASIRGLCNRTGISGMLHWRSIVLNLHRYSYSLDVGDRDLAGYQENLYPLSSQISPLYLHERIAMWENRRSLVMARSGATDDEFEKLLEKGSLKEVQEVLIDFSCKKLHTLKALSQLPNLRRLEIATSSLQNDGASGSASKNGNPSFDLAALSLKNLEFLSMMRGQELRTVDLRSCRNLKRFEFTGGYGCKDVVTIDARGLDCEITMNVNWSASAWRAERFIVHTTDALGREIETHIEPLPEEEARFKGGQRVLNFRSRRPPAKAAEKGAVAAGSLSLA